MAHVLWTYQANFQESARWVEEFNDPVEDVKAEVKKYLDVYRPDFKEKATIHIFLNDGSYHKIPAFEIWNPK